jgi:hypothetical protein
MSTALTGLLALFFDICVFQLGSRLTHRTTRKVVVLVLAMLVCVPIFSDNTAAMGREQSLRLLHRLNVEQRAHNASAWAGTGMCCYGVLVTHIPVQYIVCAL